MGADSLTQNIANAPEFICPTSLPKPKNSGFQWKMASLGIRSPWCKGRKHKNEKKTKQKTKNKNTHSIPIPHCLGMNYYVNFLGGVCSIGFHLKWIFGTQGNWKDNILGAVLELPAKQHYQFGPFTKKSVKMGWIGSAV